MAPKATPTVAPVVSPAGPKVDTAGEPGASIVGTVVGLAVVGFVGGAAVKRQMVGSWNAYVYPAMQPAQTNSKPPQTSSFEIAANEVWQAQLKLSTLRRAVVHAPNALVRQGHGPC